MQIREIHIHVTSTQSHDLTKENFEVQSNQSILTKYERQKSSNRYAFWEDKYQLGKKLKSELISTRGKESNTMAHTKLVVQKMGAKHFVRWLIFLWGLRVTFTYVSSVCQYRTLNNQQGSNDCFYINLWWLLKVSNYLEGESYSVLLYSGLT